MNLKNFLITMCMATIIPVTTDAQAQNTVFKELISYAIKAPSGHNTQPWLFRIQPNEIEILPDFCQSLPIVDPMNRELYISLGCAAENLCIAAQEKGYLPQLSVEKKDEKTYSIHIALQSASPQSHPLFASISKRQTNRSVYTCRKISRDTVSIIKNMPVESGVRFYMYIKGEDDYKRLTNYICLGNDVQMSDGAFKKELLDWIRFNSKHAEKTNNGLTNAAMGVPGVPSLIARPIVNSFLKPKTQNKSDLKKIESSSHLVLFTVKENTVEEWISLGRTLERFLLETTRLGICNAYMNQPCEVPELTETIREKLLQTNEHPMLIVRLGYASPMPYSPRKGVEDVLIP